MEFRSAFGGFFEFHTGFRFARSWTQAGVRFERDAYRGFLDLEYRCGRQWVALLKGEAFAYSKAIPSPLILTELLVTHRPNRGRFQYRLSAENLLNMRSYGIRNIQDTGYFESNTALQPRRILLQVTYRL